MPDSAASQMSSLTTIIKRLEAATSRLEDLTHHSSQSTTNSAASPSPAAGAISSAAIPSNSSTPTATGGAGAGAGAGAGEKSPSVKAYEDDIIGGVLSDYVGKSEEIGGVVAEHARLIATLTQTQLSFLQLTSLSQPPQPSNLPTLLTPTQTALMAVTEFKDKAGRTKEGRVWGNHLATVGDGVGAWGWVAVDKTPVPYIGEMKSSAQFWSNRVVKEFKESDKKQLDWAASYLALIEGLKEYVKKWHTTGVVWNPKGGDALTLSKQLSPSASTGATNDSMDIDSPPPPPPPPGPPPAAAAPTTSAGGPNAFLAELNKGGAVTSGLKKVDASMMTHKNPGLRGSGVVEAKAAPSAPAKPAALKQTQKKPPKTELDGTKWLIEYHENNNQIQINDTEINHTIHLFGCHSSVVQVKGKVNAISLVNCTKTSVLFESVVSQLSITSCPSFTVQILGQCPTIQIDTTDSGQVYLSKDCVDNVEIITSKTSAINVSVPVAGGEEGDFEERAVPEQLKSVLQGGKLVTTIVEHSG